jgi:hypothetical protein
VNWSSLFKSLYEKVRLKIACRNPSKIPSAKLFELTKKKLYLVTIKVEGYEHGSEDGDDSDGGDDYKGDDEEGNFDDCDNLDDEPENMRLINNWIRTLHLKLLIQNNPVTKVQKQFQQRWRSHGWMNCNHSFAFHIVF